MNKRETKVLETPDLEVYAVDGGFERGQHFVTKFLHTYSREALFALQCVERWAMVAGESDGEDSSGRAKLRRMTPDELVDHACETASALSVEFTRRGWLVVLPSHEGIEDVLRDAEDSN